MPSKGVTFAINPLDIHIKKNSRSNPSVFLKIPRGQITEDLIQMKGTCKSMVITIKEIGVLDV